jgi:peptidoglycan/LPS O-acetylase OafA/YrhL
LPGFCCIILGCSLLPHPSQQLGKNALSKAVLLGNASYAVYLFHSPIISYLSVFGRQYVLMPKMADNQLLWLLFLAATIISTLLGICIYTYFEEPLRKFIRSLFQSPSTKDLN